MTKPFYELALLGVPTAEQRSDLRAAITEMIADFGMMVGDEVRLLDAADVGGRDTGAAFAAAYFVGDATADSDAVEMLVKASQPVIPVVAEGDDFKTAPELLRSANGLLLRPGNVNIVELAAALLECVGLLRKQRRVFISYRRVESRQAALQLHDQLSARGFDAFLDTHAIRPGDPFQDVLWHRLVDSDLVVMLDTPTYFDSRWTREELGRARAKEIQVLRVIWPGHTPNRHTDFAESVHLSASDLVGEVGPLSEDVVADIELRVERLRSRSIAARHMSIIGKFRADIERIGGVVEAIGAHRAMAVRLEDNSRFWAYPVVGVPTAESFNDIANRAQKTDLSTGPVLLYDHIGIREPWEAHLRWLSENIPVVRTVKVAEAGWVIAAWEPAA